MPARALHLCEVLEEEHLSLYPEDAEKWTRDWRAEASQIRDAATVAAKTAAAFPDVAFTTVRPLVSAQTLADEIQQSLIQGPLLTDAFPRLPKLSRSLRGRIRRERKNAEAVQTLNRAILDELLHGELKLLTNAEVEADIRSRVIGRCIHLFGAGVFSFASDARDLETAKEGIVTDLNALIDRETVLTDEFSNLHLNLDLSTQKQIDDADRENAGERRRANRLIVDAIAGDALQSGEEARLNAYFAKVHARAETDDSTSALCISGGGIRSATFALGVLQGLARRNILDKFDFISTVSGGGYIGSWLSSWMRRHPEGSRGVAEDLARCPENRLDPEPPPLRHLREYSNYLSPKLGLTSGDTWSLVGTYVCNLLLNWLILVPLLLIVLALPRLLAATSFTTYSLAGIHSTIWLAAAGGISLLIGVIYFGLTRPAFNRYTKKEADDADGRFRVWGLMPMVIGSALLAAAWSARTIDHEKPVPFWWLVAVFSVVPLIPWVVYFWRYANLDVAQRREDVAAASRGQKTNLKKGAWEFLAAVVGGVISGLILAVIARNLFPRPAQPFDGQTFPSPLAPMLDHSPIAALYVCFAVPLILLTLFISASIFVGISSRVNEDYDREWWARASGYTLSMIITWPIVTAIVIFGPVLLYFAPKIITALGGVTGVTAVLLGRSGKTAAKEGGNGGTSNLVAKLAAPVAIIFILAALSLLTTEIVGIVDPPPAFDATFDTVQSRLHDTVPGPHGRVERVGPLRPMFDSSRVGAWQHLYSFYAAPPWVTLALIGALAVLAFLASYVVNVNKFSMHAMYRNRLIRAYLGASRTTRDPNPFTGFDPQDNVQVNALRPALLWFTSFRDVDSFVAKMRNPKGDFQIWLEKEITKRHSTLLDGSLERDPLQAALFQVLNCILDETDLHKMRTVSVPSRKPTFSGSHPSVPAQESLRLLQNREALDAEFPEELYPYTAPLLHRGDLRNPRSFVATLKEGNGKVLVKHFTRPLPALDPATVNFHNELQQVLEEINRLIVSFDLATFASLKEQDYTKATKNRRRIEQLFGASVHPLRQPRPLHIVNMALNLVAGDKLAWQERKAESFTATPLHVGSYALGYRTSTEYGGSSGISLGTAVTISGAAASPNMGYHSNSTLAFLMTLFNVRLGWWLGNPGPHGNDTYYLAGPALALGPLLAEATADTNDRYPYVYLSDGGHFENLGIYEMVLRRRHHIIVSDAGCDLAFNFDDLGNAIRKIRIDFGIPIEMSEPMYLYPRGDEKIGKYCAYGRICYSRVDPNAPDGELLYIKPAIYLSEPKDVYNYAKASATFPHESTADQFFSESQFESYRMLGFHTIEQISSKRAEAEGMKENWTAASIGEFIAAARDYLV